MQRSERDDPRIAPVPVWAETDLRRSVSPQIDRQARAFARLVTGSRAAGDDLVTMALGYTVTPARSSPDSADAFRALLQAMRMLLRVRPPQHAAGQQPAALQGHARLPIDVREASALSFALGLSAEEIAILLDRTPAEIEALIARSWGSYMSLLACCPQR